MKLSFVHRFTVHAAALALSLAALEAAGESLTERTASNTNGIPIGAIKRDAQKMLEAISAEQYTGNENIGWMAQVVPHREDGMAREDEDEDTRARTGSQTNSVLRLQMIAEQIATGEAKEIRAIKPVTGDARVRP
ncbi:hypothetical protein [Paraburkholderia rhizosphaerae]|uniref:Uncharacterized protein n=1 Tax=Paraburkholderia rhizosphaerae TaxID=480658 RepID=A0A4R8LGM9_9BURK|nr:hypothetical protein [Paraburkholderia rhizosphaerae]TDY42291.1 hypothetical protein BX592_122100 [Paraburkholderia rhizosphaerae]